MKRFGATTRCYSPKPSWGVMLKWGVTHRSGVLLTKVGCYSPKWGVTHQSGMIPTKVGCYSPKWGVTHQRGMIPTKVGCYPPKWGVTHQSGVSLTEAEPGRGAEASEAGGGWLRKQTAGVGRLSEGEARAGGRRTKPDRLRAKQPALHTQPAG